MALPLSSAVRIYNDILAGKKTIDSIPRGVSRSTVEAVLRDNDLPVLPTTLALKKESPWIATGGAYSLTVGEGSLGLQMAVAEAFPDSPDISRVLYAYLFKNGILLLVSSDQAGSGSVTHIGKLPQVRPNMQKYKAVPVKDVPPGYLVLPFKGKVVHV